MNTVNIREVPRASSLGPTYEKKLSVYFILASVLFERMAFYALASNLVTFLQSKDIQWDSGKSSYAVYLFFGVTHFATLLFAVISDGKLGQILTIRIGFVLYMLGYTLITISTHGGTGLCNFETTNSCYGAIVSALVCAAFGAAAVKANVAVLGAQQLQHHQQKWRYFEKYVLLVNIGSIISAGMIPLFGNSSKAYFYLNLISCFMLLLAAVLFSIGARYSNRSVPYDSIIYHCCPVLSQACRTWCRYKQPRSSSEANLQESANVIGEEDPMRIAERTLSFLDYARLANHAKFHDRIINDVRSLRSALAVFVLLIPFWLIYSQSSTALRLQGKQMRYGETRAANAMGFINPTIICIGIILFNIFTCKYFDKYDPTKRITAKLIIGMIFSCLSMCYSGIIEIARQSDSYCSFEQNQSNLSVYYQVPEYVSIGIAELFGTVSSYEFAFFSAPRSGLSLFMSLVFCSIGAAFFLAMDILHSFPRLIIPSTSCTNEPWMQKRFYVYFFVLAAIQLVTVIVFLGCVKKFRIVRLIAEKLRPNRFSVVFTQRNDTVSSDNEIKY